MAKKKAAKNPAAKNPAAKKLSTKKPATRKLSTEKTVSIQPLQKPATDKQLQEALQFLDSYMSDKWDELPMTSEDRLQAFLGVTPDDSPDRMLQSLMKPWQYPSHPWQNWICNGCKKAGTFCELHKWIPATRGGEQSIKHYLSQLQEGLTEFVPPDKRLSGNVYAPKFVHRNYALTLDSHDYDSLRWCLEQWLWWWVASLYQLLLVQASWRESSQWASVGFEGVTTLSRLNQKVEDSRTKPLVRDSPEERKEELWATFCSHKRSIIGLPHLAAFLLDEIGGMRELKTLSVSPSPFVFRSPFSQVFENETLPGPKPLATYDRYAVPKHKEPYGKAMMRTDLVPTSPSEFIYRMPAGYYLCNDGSPQVTRSCYALSLCEAEVMRNFTTPGLLRFQKTPNGKKLEELFWASMVQVAMLRQLWIKFMLNPIASRIAANEYADKHNDTVIMIDDLMKEQDRKFRRELQEAKP